MPGTFYPNCKVIVSVVLDDLTPLKTGNGASRPTLQGADANHPLFFEVRPKAATVHLNGYREADTFELAFDAAKFPFSPELVRSMGVQIHLFQTDSLAGQALSSRSDVYIEDFSYELPAGETLENGTLAISGLVDEASYHAGSDGRSFHVSGRDYTCLMLDRQWDTSKRLEFPKGARLEDVVRDLVRACDANGALTVQVVGSDETPVLDKPNAKESALLTAGKYTQKAVHKTRKGPSKSTPKPADNKTHTNAKGVPVHHGSNYWDVIYRLCVTHGYIVFVRGNSVVISKPQILTEATAGRVRSVAYGEDLSSLEIQRKLGKETTPQIEVHCWNPKTSSTLIAKFPEKKADKITGIGTKKNETVVMNVSGITDVTLLRDFAETAYHNLARSESSVKFVTRDLKDLEGSNLLFLRPGDPVSIGFNAVEDKDFRQMSTNERLDKLLALGYDLSIAEVVAADYENINQFRQPYYTKDVEFSWDAQQGLTIAVTGVNYVSVERDNAN